MCFKAFASFTAKSPGSVAIRWYKTSRGNRELSEQNSNMNDSGVDFDDPLIGSYLGEYKILSLLGKGSMGCVYKGHHTRLDRIVAIKTLSKFNADAIRRFENEVRIHSRLSHKNIVQAIDFHVDPRTGQPFFIMEYLNGISVMQLLAQGGIENEEMLLQVVSQICDALSYAHGIGVLHRDLKSGNILLVEEPDGALRVKVVDFGIAKIQEDLQRLTKTGFVVGSPIYMSPEQCLGEKVDARTDVYSLGVLLYEMLTMHVPYDEQNILHVMAAHCDPLRKPGSITVFNLRIIAAQQLDAIIRTAMEHNPNDRFQSVADLKSALEFWHRSVISGNHDLELPVKQFINHSELSKFEIAEEEPKHLSASEQESLRNLVAVSMAKPSDARGAICDTASGVEEN